MSQRADDQLLAGIATYRVGSALLALGRARPALEVNVNIANRLAPGDGNGAATPERLSVYGMLLLKGAMAAARIGDSATVRDLVGGAEEAAGALGGDHNHYWTCFGPTNVQLHRAAAAVELGEGRPPSRPTRASTPEGFAALLPERRAHHYLDIARGVRPDRRRRARPARCCWRATGWRPSEIRCRPIAHEVLVRRAAAHPGHAAGAGRGAGRAHGSRRMTRRRR